jgi:hypothetical protein
MSVRRCVEVEEGMGRRLRKERGGAGENVLVGMVGYTT